MGHLKKLAAYVEIFENVIRIYCFYQTMWEILKRFTPKLLRSLLLTANKQNNRARKEINSEVSSTDNPAIQLAI